MFDTKPPVYVNIAEPNSQPSTNLPSLPIVLETQMSTLVGNPAVPKGKYYILAAADLMHALEMQSGGDFKVHIAKLDESRQTQVMSQY
jgi:hypothetical protein